MGIGSISRMLRWLAAMALPYLVGCTEPLPSSWYATQEIYAHMKAVQNESGTVLTTVQLRNSAASNAAYLYLDKGENLYASLNKSPEQLLNFNEDLFANAQLLSNDLMQMQPRGLISDYLLFTNVAYGTEYFVSDTPESALPTRAYVSLERDDQMSSSFVDIPATFRIDEPAPESTLSRSAALQLSWSAAEPGTDMWLDVAGLCDADARYTLSLYLGQDSGTKTLATTDYFITGTDTSQISGTIAPQSNCRLVFMLKRIRTVAASAVFAPGSDFQGIQQRSVQFTSVP